MNKRALIKKIIAELAGGLELYSKAAHTARAEATDEQSKAENKYDTRGLEASYLARGQSKQMAETELAIKEFEKLVLRNFSAKEAIDVGALVELESRGDRFLYFLGPRAGGTEVVYQKKEVTVITPQSPLGQELCGKKQGDCVQMQAGPMRDEYRIVSVS